MAKAKTSNKKLMHTIIALVIWAIFKWLIPAPEPMTDTGMEIVGVFIMATYLWITVETGWTSILVVSMVAISGAMSATAAIKGSFGDWMFAFLMACMLVNHVLSETGISRRIAVWFITRKFVKGRPYIIVLMFFAAMFVLGLGMTSSATCVMFLALAKEILDTCGYDRKDKFSQFLFCCIAAITIAGNGMTAIGHGNFITGMGWVGEAFGLEISIAQSAAIGMSIGVVWILLVVLIMAKIYKIDASKLVNLDIDALRATIPPMSKKEKFAGIMFLVVIFFWVGKDLLKGLTRASRSSQACVTSSPASAPLSPVLLCVCVFCVVPIDGEPLMKLQQGDQVHRMAELHDDRYRPSARHRCQHGRARHRSVDPAGVRTNGPGSALLRVRHGLHRRCAAAHELRFQLHRNGPLQGRCSPDSPHVRRERPGSRRCNDLRRSLRNVDSRLHHHYLHGRRYRRRRGQLHDQVDVAADDRGIHLPRLCRLQRWLPRILSLNLLF